MGDSQERQKKLEELVREEQIGSRRLMGTIERMRLYVIAISGFLIALTLVSIWFKLQTPPMVSYSLNSSEVLAAQICPGEPLELVRGITVQEAPALVDIFVTIWDPRRRVTIYDSSWSRRAIYLEQGEFETMVTVPVGNLEPGSYQLRVGSQSENRDPSVFSVPFEVLDGCTDGASERIP